MGKEEGAGKQKNQDLRFVCFGIFSKSQSVTKFGPLSSYILSLVISKNFHIRHCAKSRENRVKANAFSLPML